MDMSSAPRLSALDREIIADRLNELIALLDALDQAELLSDVPEKPGARARHEMGARLLALLGRQLCELRAAVVDSPIDRAPARPI